MILQFFLLSLASVAAVWGTQLYAEPATPQKKIAILLGPPGSGKGTQAKRLSRELQVPHISTGDLFRENLSKGTELGKQVKEYMESGRLVPDAIVLDMLKARLGQPDCEKGYLLDGFPRSIPQAEALDKIVEKSASVTVVNLQVPDEAIVKRIEGRMSCSECGAIYNKYFNPPGQDGLCDLCGGELTHRSDDTREVIEERLRTYHGQTKPLEEYYAKKGLLHNVDADRPPEEVYSEIQKLF